MSGKAGGGGLRVTGAARREAGPQAARSRPGGQGGPQPADLVGLGGQGPVAQQLGPQLLQAPGVGQVADPHVGHGTLHADGRLAASPCRQGRCFGALAGQSERRRGPTQPIAPSGPLLSPPRPAGADGIGSPAGGQAARCRRPADYTSQGAPRRGRVVPPCRGEEEEEEDGDSGRMESGEGRRREASPGGGWGGLR